MYSPHFTIRQPSRVCFLATLVWKRVLCILLDESRKGYGFCKGSVDSCGQYGFSVFICSKISAVDRHLAEFRKKDLQNSGYEQLMVFLSALFTIMCISSGLKLLFRA